MTDDQDFDETIPRSPLSKAVEDAMAIAKLERFLKDYLIIPSVWPPPEKPGWSESRKDCKPPRRSRLRRFIDWLRNSFFSTPIRYRDYSKRKPKNSTEQMATLDDLFETDWDARIDQLQKDYYDKLNNMKAKHAEELKDAYDDFMFEYRGLKHDKIFDEHRPPEAPPPQPTFEI